MQKTAKDASASFAKTLMISSALSKRSNQQKTEENNIV